MKELFDGLSLIIEEGEKVALIGRNGLGKTTLFRNITGEDKEYTGELEFQKGIRVILTRQEHFVHKDLTPIDYVLEDVPDYADLKAAINHYEQNTVHDMEAITKYSDAVMEFSEKGYYDIEDKIIESLKDFEIDFETAMGPFNTLSGGQKRFVELVRVMYSNADLALIDEPTNHMDYVGKAAFIKWFNATKQTVLVVTHDRDVLQNVDRIVELKEKRIYSFNGNYDSYLKQNSSGTATAVFQYEMSLKRIDNMKKQIQTVAKQGKKNRTLRIRSERFERELGRLESGVEKPSFWIDQDSMESVGKDVVEKYDRYKEKNITIKSAGSAAAHKKLLMNISKFSVGYKVPLFSDISFELYNYDRLFIKGRNGAGKSTLIKTIISLMNGKPPVATLYKGEYKFSPSIVFGTYEQEVNEKYMNKSLSDAILTVYNELDLPINAQKISALLGNYLFDPILDADLTFKNLSGGQKARFQIIKMLANNPNLLILDEPTNHLDLPSIEELENALNVFTGAIIYITHDTYLEEKLGGRVVEI